MLFTTQKLAALLSLTALAAAVPAGNLVARTSQYVLPSLIVPIESNAGDESFGASNTVQVSNVFVTGATTYDDLLRFDNIPDSAFWCYLALEMPDPSALQISGASTLNVYSVNRNTTATDTWNNSPQKDSLVASLNMQGVGPETILTQERCHSSLSYRLEIADLSKVGSIHFEQTDVTGFRVKF